MTPNQKKTCPSCGAEAKGNFCARCGAALGRTECPECGKTPPAGARFCNHCGAALAAAPAPGGPAARGPTGGSGGGDGRSNIAWWVAGALMVILILVAAYPIYGPDRSDPPAAGTQGASAGGAGGSAGPLNMSMEEAAYRLFVRVMSAADTADTATVEQFRPMAISAYEQTAPLTEDARYHMALIHQAAGDHASALEVAEAGLAESPDHLLLLSAAGESSLALGDTAAALERFRHLLEVWDTEMAAERQEYVDHGTQMPEIRERARAAVEGQG